MPTPRLGTLAHAAALLVALNAGCARLPPPPLADGGGHRQPSRLEILRHGESLHSRVRALTLLPGESVRLTNAADTSPVAPAVSTIAPVFEVRAHTFPGARVRWDTDGGRVATASRGSATVARWIAPDTPGTYRLRLRDGDGHATDAQPEIVMLVLTPFTLTSNGSLSGYVIGEYPAGDRHTPEQPRESPPVPGFVAVTPHNQDVALSAHFRLRDFLCKQQPEHFPKYLALDVRLLDKLERLVDALTVAHGRVPRVTVMSAFRTPYYNRAIGNETPWSRHTLGDAADVFVDDDGDGVMDDLDHDGAITAADADALLRVVDTLDGGDTRIAGGAAAYGATAAHGPFVHLDVRGSRARW